MSSQENPDTHDTTESSTSRRSGTFYRPPAWLQRAQTAGKGHLLQQLLDFASDHKLSLAPPHYTLYHTEESSIPLSEVRDAIMSGIREEDQEVLKDLEISGLARVEQESLPFTLPPDCRVRRMSRTSHYEIYPASGTGWGFANPSRTCGFVCQAGLSVRQLIWDTLVPQEQPSAVLGACQVRDYYTRPLPHPRQASREELTAYKTEFQPILQGTGIRAGWYDLPDMARKGRIRLAAAVAAADFEDRVTEMSSLLERQGWTVHKLSIKRGAEGEIEDCEAAD